MLQITNRCIAIVYLLLCPFNCPGDATSNASHNTLITAVPAGKFPYLAMNSVNDPDQSKPNLQQVELSEGIFLVANRNLADPNFSQTVILLTEYSNTGTCGLIINRRADLLVTDLFPKQDNMNSLTDKVRMGGPVALNRVQILFQAKNTPVGARHIVENIFLVNSIPLLNQISRGDFLPEALNVYAGYAGWATGQLETELLRGDWYLWQADAATVFKKPAQEIWPDLIRLVTTLWVDNQSDKRPLFSHTSLYY